MRNLGKGYTASSFLDGWITTEKPSDNHLNLSAIEIPDLVLGSIKNFRNFNLECVLDYQFRDGKLVIFISELDRLESVQESHSTVEAFLYEVERPVRPEKEVFHVFRFDSDFAELHFIVDRALLEQDISAEMIEQSIVEDTLKYQLYSRKAFGVTVYYKDAVMNEAFVVRNYPQKNKTFLEMKVTA